MWAGRGMAPRVRGTRGWIPVRHLGEEGLSMGLTGVKGCPGREFSEDASTLQKRMLSWFGLNDNILLNDKSGIEFIAPFA